MHWSDGKQPAFAGMEMPKAFTEEMPSAAKARALHRHFRAETASTQTETLSRRYGLYGDSDSSVILRQTISDRAERANTTVY